MTRDRRLRRATAVAFATAVLAAGCSAAPEARPAPTSAPSVDESPAGAEQSPAEHSPDEPGAPEPGSMQTPGETSGRLSRRDFPRPTTLGDGWSYAVDPGDGEEGYVGNDTPALARSPREIVQTAVPFGCARSFALPVPRHALEVDYSASGTTVIAVRSQFADEETARAFFDHRRQNLEVCEGRGGGAVGPLVTDLQRYGAHMLLNGRTQQSDPWMELAVLDGDAVVLVATQNRSDRPPLTSDTARRLADSFRTR